MAPAVDLQDALPGVRDVPDTGPQGLKKDAPVEGQVLVVHPGEQDVVTEDLLLQLRAPEGLSPEGEGLVRKSQKELGGIAVQIALRQMGV